MNLAWFPPTLLSAVLFAGCSGGAGIAPSARAPGSGVAPASLSVAADSSPLNYKIYVANYGDNTVTTYKADGTRTTPTITAGLSFPWGVAVDKNGKIYVANNNFTVTTYNPDGKRTTPTIMEGFFAPNDVAVDANGKILLTLGNNFTVTSFKLDGKRTGPTITGLSQPMGIALH